MKLSSDDFYKAFSEKLEKNWTESRKCPICGKVAWKTAKKPAKADIWGESHAPEKKSMGFGVVACGNCGYTLLFNAIALGFGE